MRRWWRSGSEVAPGCHPGEGRQRQASWHRCLAGAPQEDSATEQMKGQTPQFSETESKRMAPGVRKGERLESSCVRDTEFHFARNQVLGLGAVMGVHRKFSLLLIYMQKMVKTRAGETAQRSAVLAWNV